MKVLVLGHRKNLCECLSDKSIPFLLWVQKDGHFKVNAEKIIIQNYCKTSAELNPLKNDLMNITHVIASSENAVIPASFIRKEFKLKRNPHNMAIRCADKYEMKKYLFDLKIEMTPFKKLKHLSEVEDLLKEWGTPIFAKPRLNSGGRGLVRIYNRDEAKDLRLADYIFEKGINGSEGSVESFISGGKIQFTNITEYYEHGKINLVPGHYSEDINRQILNLNERVLSALKINWGMTHLEFYLTDKGILFGEVALRPPGGYIMEAMELAYESSAWEHFVSIELGLNVQFQELRNWAASCVFYPSSDSYYHQRDVGEVKKLISVKELVIKKKLDGKVAPREGIGQNYGHALMKHKNKKGLKEDISQLREILKDII